VTTTARYNLAYTRFQLGRCDGVLELLERSKKIQGHRDEIDSLRKQAKDSCG
jgi:transcription initiation factor IIE alpha subunit